MADYERVLSVKNEVFVYRIPPRTTNRGYRAADWKLDQPDWTGRLKVVALNQQLCIKLEDKNTGELFAKCPVDAYPGVAVESVLDSSRYFVIKIQDGSGKSAFIGIGFSDRGDSFDLNVALQDHFKQVSREEELKKGINSLQDGPKLDLSFKEGQTIKININSKKSGDEASKSRPKVSLGAGLGGGLLPPPPPPGGSVRTAPQQTQSGSAANSNTLLDFGGSATSNNSNQTTASKKDWVGFD